MKAGLENSQSLIHAKMSLTNACKNVFLLSSPRRWNTKLLQNHNSGFKNNSLLEEMPIKTSFPRSKLVPIYFN